MRLAVLALSAAAISGCSWLGGSGHYTAQPGCYNAGVASYGHQQTGYQYGYAQGGVGCVGGAYGGQHYGAQYGAQAYGAQGYGAQGYAPQMASAQGMPGQAMAQGYAAQSYGMNPQMAAPNMAGFNGVGATAAGGYQATATTLGAAAPYGAAVSTQQISGQYGQAPYGQGAGVQTVVGAPIYVPQPYPAPYLVPQVRQPICCGGGGRVSGGGVMPFGLEVFVGTELNSSGEIFTKKSDGPPDGDFTIDTRVGEIDPIGYDDAFGNAKTIGLALAKDISPSTTLLGSISHSQSEGQTVESYTTVEPGTWAGGVFTPQPGTAPRELDGTFSDLELTTIEGGVRQYVGHDPSFRPYVGASGGFTHNNDVQFTQTFNDDGSFYGTRRFVDSGWSPTAAATLGAEMAVSPRAAIGIESGVRWRGSMDSGAPSEDRVTIPLTLRGRLAF